MNPVGIVMRTLHQAYKDFWTPEFWKQWREAESPYRRYKSERDRQLALHLLELKDGDRVLEIGCGYGWISQALIRSARIKWVGIDLSNSMMQHCLQTIPGGFGALADALLLPFHTGVFDTILCSGVLMHVEDEVKALKEMVRVLKPGGRLVISGNNLFSPFALPVRLWNLQKQQYKQSFRSPWCYRRWLNRLGFRVECTAGDTLLAVELRFPGGIGTIPPRQWFKAVVSLDQFLGTPLRYFAFETWFAAVKLT
jgi:SAM-dependent methyltransferase